MTYDFLKPFMDSGQPLTAKVRNVFYPVAEKDILEAEKQLGCNFPSQLKEFYKEIGYGFLKAPHNPPPDYDFYSTNRISDPLTIVEFCDLAMLHHQKPEKERISLEALLNLDEFYKICDGGVFSIEALECLQPGDLPFFEIGDSSSFMIMKLNSDNPNAVWSDCGVKIEDSFERFIWRLYYEDPGYYGDIITRAYGIYIDKGGNILLNDKN